MPTRRLFCLAHSAAAYIESFNVTAERSLPYGFDLTTSYVGAHTIRQTLYLEANAGQTPGLGAAGQPLFPLFGRNAETQVIAPSGGAHYDALQMNLKHAFKGGVLLTAAPIPLASRWTRPATMTLSPLFNAAAYQYRNYAGERLSTESRTSKRDSRQSFPSAPGISSSTTEA